MGHHKNDLGHALGWLFMRPNLEWPIICDQLATDKAFLRRQIPITPSLPNWPIVTAGHLSGMLRENSVAKQSRAPFLLPCASFCHPERQRTKYSASRSPISPPSTFRPERTNAGTCKVHRMTGMICHTCQLPAYFLSVSVPSVNDWCTAMRWTRRRVKTS